MAIKIDKILGEVRELDVGVTSVDGKTGTVDLSGDYEPKNSNIQSHILSTSNPHGVTKTQVGLSNVTDDAQLKISSNLSDLNSASTARTNLGLGSASVTDIGTSSGNVPVLDGGGKLSIGVLPGIALTDTFVVADQAAMLALTAETGDVAVRTDVNKSFILKGASASTLADWQELLTPTDNVHSVFGRQGTITAQENDYTLSQIGMRDHDLLTGLSDDDHTQYALLAGRSGGQSLSGGTAANEDLTLQGTTNATRTTSYVLLQPNGGNVGIGTASPGAKLEVNGGITASGNIFLNTATAQLSSGADVWPLIFGIGAVEIARIDTSGSLGIGTSSPATKLEVSGVGTFSAGLQVTFGTSGLSFGASRLMRQMEGTSIAREYICGSDASTYGTYEFYTAKSNGSPTLAYSVNASGNVGIGTTSPAGKLDIDQSSTTGAIPVLKLDQADVSEEFIEFVSTSTANNDNPISTTSVGTFAGKLRISVNGTYYWLPYYNS